METEYQAGTWSQSRRVVINVESFTVSHKHARFINKERIAKRSSPIARIAKMIRNQFMMTTFSEARVKTATKN